MDSFVCDCGAPESGTWAAIHGPECATNNITSKLTEIINAHCHNSDYYHALDAAREIVLFLKHKRAFI